MKVEKRLLKYIAIKTPCDENSDTVPTSQCQFDLARILADELKELGLDKVVLDDKCFVYGILAATPGYENKKKLGLIAHMDTVPEFCEAEIHPVCTPDYDGCDLVLGDSGRVLTTKDFPHLKGLKGRTLITSDGNTILGVDDKAGIAEIIQAMVYLREHPEIKHGRIRVGFNPDEEIGMGAHLFDVEKFGCEWAYTMDGGEVGELEFENFNAAAAKVTVRGLNVHPGYAKGKMRNSMLVAAEFIRRMPSDETPQTTEGYEGFYHLTGMKGTVEETVLSYIIRDHDRQKFENRKAFVRQLAEELNAENGEGTVTVEVRDQYYNMREKVEPVMYIIDIAKKAIEASGVECRVKAIRGGTDGAQLSFKGLPCPNIFAGGLNFHGRHEFVPVQSMEKAMMTIVKIAELTALR